MAKTLPLLAIGILLLAGCSSPGETGSAASSVSTPPVTTVVGASSGPVFTDTLHLLGRPALTPAMPHDGNPLRIPITPFAQQLASGYFDEAWDWTWESDRVGLVGNWTIWVEVTGDVVNDPQSPLYPVDCFWQFSIIVGSYDTGDFHGLNCIPEPTNVPQGIRALSVPFDLPNLAIPAGTPVHFEMHVQDLSRSPGAEVNVLTGATGYDSHLTIAGLQLEVPRSLLLESPK